MMCTCKKVDNYVLQALQDCKFSPLNVQHSYDQCVAGASMLEELLQIVEGLSLYFSDCDGRYLIRQDCVVEVVSSLNDIASLKKVSKLIRKT